MLTAITAGYLLGLGLIVAIGAQNAFVLRQGLIKQHVLAICLTCALSDALLIIAGVAGFGLLADGAPAWAIEALKYGGAAFLFVYGALSLTSALKGGGHLDPAENRQRPLLPALATCLALTWLNPHVYLDTVVLIGSVSTQYPGQGPAFALGAVVASFSFFFALGYGARLLQPVFARPVAWRYLDAGIAAIMWMIAISLMIS